MAFLSEDSISDDLVPEPMIPASLPNPSLGNLPELEAQMRGLNNTAVGREALTKLVINENYIRRLIPLVEMAEDMEDLPSLHRLCTMMKIMILLNDNSIVEHIVTDEVVLGVVGALEYDPDFPSHKANHRLWLGREGRYKEVVRIGDDNVRRKIHHTYRLQYLKDVVLARILDDPTFSVLNGLIFFNQVEIVQHLQTNTAFLKDLFGIFGPQETDQERKKEAVLFIQQCCAIAKNLQQPARQTLYNNFLGHGLLSVINFALRHNDVGVRVGATDVLVSMIDHDPQMIRQTIFRQMNEKQTPLTDSLIDLLLVEADLGVKAQIADAIKVLLDPGSHPGPMEGISKANGEFGARLRSQADPQHELFLNHFYDVSAKKLFKPLVDLKGREDMNFTVHQVSLFIYLIEILCFFIRQHTNRSKYFVLTAGLAQRISQLLGSPEKYLKLTALKFFRNLVGLQDEFYNQQMMQDHLFEPVLDLVIETMPRDNLLNSACLEFFEFIKNQGPSQVLLTHLVENYREKFDTITYVDIFSIFVLRYDNNQGSGSSIETPFLDTEDEDAKRPEIERGTRWGSGIKDLDAEEEAYFNTSDDEEEKSQTPQMLTNGASPVSKPLVDYPSDEENENSENDVSVGVNSAPLSRSPPSPKPLASKDSKGDEGVMTPTSPTLNPPERLSEKRRREEDEEDELGKLSNHKRRSSTSSSASNSSVVRRKQSFNKTRDGSNGPKKIAISLSPAIKTGGDSPGGSTS
ncbi:Platinum sensitivity protein [Ciborinia camelliae]|nr:Platinum sensitivity protein [Ciborinia camelliae]